MKKSLLNGFLIAFGITLSGCGTNQNLELINTPANGHIIEHEATNEATGNELGTSDIEKVLDEENVEQDSSYALADSNEIDTIEKDKESKLKILVLYFSRADENYSVGIVDKGNTKFLAEHIANYLNADMFEIEPKIPYPVNYDETTDIAKKELNDNARPEYKGDINNWSNYDTIFLGYPIRWGDLPMVVYTFIESHNFSGKNIYLFNTHEGSGIAGTYKSLKNKLNTANVNTDGLPMKGSDARKDSAKGEVEKWLKDLGF